MKTTQLWTRTLATLTASLLLAGPALAQSAPQSNPLPNTQPDAEAEARAVPAPTPSDTQPVTLGQSGIPLQSQRDEAWRFNVYLENDSQWLKPNADTDRWYTNGIKLEATHQPQWAQKILPDLPFAAAFDKSAKHEDAKTFAAVGYHVGQLMFTPRNIDMKAPQPGDRPFAGYLFGGMFLQRANDITLDHFQVDLGIVGPSSFAEDTQKFIHRNIAGDNPRGWDNQMRDEPAIQAYLRKKWRLSAGDITFGDDADSPTLHFQLLPELGAALGTVYRHAEAGVTLRAGFKLPDDFGPGYISNPASATGNPTPKGFSGYGFVGVMGKAVEHDLFLDGSDFRSNRVDVNHKPLVGQASAGFQLNYRKDNFNISATYSQIYNTRDFRDQPGTPSWGNLRIACSVTF